MACRQHKQECTYRTQTRKRPPKKDAKYVIKLESNLRQVETRFAEVAPEEFALFKNDVDRRDTPRHQRTGSRKIESPSDPSTVTLPASATLLADAHGVRGYLGILTTMTASLIRRADITLVIFAGDSDICSPCLWPSSNYRIGDSRLPAT